MLRKTSGWLHLSKRSGKPPFNVVVTVDTTGLAEATGYKEMLEIWSGRELIHYEPIYLTTQVYEYEQLVEQPYAFPLLAGKAKRNIFWFLVDGFLTLYHLILTLVYLWIGLFLLIVIGAVIVGIISG